MHLAERSLMPIMAIAWIGAANARSAIVSPSNFLVKQISDALLHGFHRKGLGEDVHTGIKMPMA